MNSNSKLSAPTKLVIRFVLTILLVWAIHTFLPDLFLVIGGLPAYIIIGALLTLMNIIVRPIFTIVLFPFKLFATMLALVVANGGFLWLTERIAQELDPDVVILQVTDSMPGWIFIAFLLGIANWIIKEILR